MSVLPWIKTSDRLPDEDAGDVVFCLRIEEGPGSFVSGYYDCIKKKFIQTEEFGDTEHDPSDVKAWLELTPPLAPLSEPPSVGDIVYHDSDGLVKCRVLWYGTNYGFVGVETIEDLGDDGHFRPGHRSIREWQDLFEEIQ